MSKKKRPSCCLNIGIRHTFRAVNAFHQLFLDAIDKHFQDVKEGDIPKFISRMLKIITNTSNRIERGQQLRLL